MAIITEKLQLNKHFLIIDSPVPFTLMANNGTDSVYRMAGAWQIDTWKLLPEEYMKQYPVFNLDLIYDDTNLNGGSVIVRESNIDVGDGIAGVNGQDVRVTNNDDKPVPIRNYENNGVVVPVSVDVTNLNTIDLSVVAQENTLSGILSYLPELKKKCKYFELTNLTELNNLINNLLNDFGLQFDNLPTVYSNTTWIYKLLPIFHYQFDFFITVSGSDKHYRGNNIQFKTDSSQAFVSNCGIIITKNLNDNSLYLGICSDRMDNSFIGNPYTFQASNKSKFQYEI